MSTRRSTPHFDRTQIVERLRHCRQAMIELRMGSPSRSLARASADQMIANIDELCWILTGNREELVLQPHGTPHPLPKG